MNEHVDPKRLFEMAGMDVIFEEPEWAHMKQCDACLERFAEFVRQIHSGKTKRLQAS
jgi:hypothetical protein